MTILQEKKMLWNDIGAALMTEQKNFKDFI